jgi:hypothetical protein
MMFISPPEASTPTTRMVPKLGRCKLWKLLSQMEIAALRMNVVKETIIISSSVFQKLLIN